MDPRDHAHMAVLAAYCHIGYLRELGKLLRHADVSHKGIAGQDADFELKAFSDASCPLDAVEGDGDIALGRCLRGKCGQLLRPGGA